MDTKMTHTARAALANAIRRRYRSAKGKEKGKSIRIRCRAAARGVVSTSQR